MAINRSADRRLQRVGIVSLVLAMGFGWMGAGVAVERVEEGNLVIEGIPAIPPDVAAQLEQFQHVRSAINTDWLPDGEGLLITTRFGETYQLHVVDQPGGARQQITFFDETVSGGTFSPAAGRNGFLFGKDVGGSEFYQIFYYDLAERTYKMLTDGESRNGGAVWANEGNQFAYYTTRRNGRDWDLYLYDLEKATARPIWEDEGVWIVQDWSPDDTRLIIEKIVSSDETYPYLLSLETGELTALHQAEGRVTYGTIRFSADGTGLYYTSDEAGEFFRLRYRDLQTGETTVLTPDINWDIEGLDLSENGQYLAFTANENGYSRLYIMDTQSGELRPLPSLPQGLIAALDFNSQGTHLAMTMTTPQSPGDVYTLALDTAELTRWTYSETGGLAAETFVEPSLIQYETFDSVEAPPASDGTAGPGTENPGVGKATAATPPRTIPAFYYQPEGTGPFPVLIDIHGGPASQERPTFSSWTQYLVNEMGIAVIAPNVRGSTGYGRNYTLLDNGYLREDSVRDIGALLDWIATQPELDANRVAVMGGSYGGYMVLAALTHYNDRLRAGISMVGISNFVTFLENTQDYRRDLRRAEYGDERDPEMRDFLLEISPLTNADRITSPLFVAQGLNDPRVPASESEQIVAEVRENGGTVWYLLAKDEGHGFAKKSNRDYFRQAVSLFLEEFLLPADNERPSPN